MTLAPQVVTVPVDATNPFLVEPTPIHRVEQDQPLIAIVTQGTPVLMEHAHTGTVFPHQIVMSRRYI